MPAPLLIILEPEKKFASTSLLARALLTPLPDQGEGRVRVSFQRGAKRRAIHVIARKKARCRATLTRANKWRDLSLIRERLCKTDPISIRLRRHFDFLTTRADA